jgi:hypothetical protein
MLLCLLQTAQMPGQIRLPICGVMGLTLEVWFLKMDAMRNRANKDYEIPLEELYAGFPIETREWITKTIFKIRLYFGGWLLFLAFSTGIILFVLSLRPADESIDTWFQRVGTLIVLLTSLGETIFVVKLRAMAKVSHWAQLSCEIYVERRYKKYLVFSLVVSAFLIIFGSLIGGYGDLFYRRWILLP